MGETTMTREEREAARALLDEADEYAGCGDTSCLLTRRRGGQATNGGCRCMDRPEGRLVYRQLARIARTHLPRALDAIDALEAERDELRALLRQARQHVVDNAANLGWPAANAAANRTLERIDAALGDG